MENKLFDYKKLAIPYIQSLNSFRRRWLAFRRDCQTLRCKQSSALFLLILGEGTSYTTAQWRHPCRPALG
jgi:hypothetical protein